MITTLASIGLPGLCGFVGEFMILLGTFGSTLLPHAKLLTILATTGVVLGAIYMLLMYQKVFLGAVRVEKNRGLPDLGLREWVVLVPLVVFMFWLGVGPGLVLNKIGPSLDRVLQPLALEQDAPPHVEPHALRLTELPVESAGSVEVVR
jgi:NADH-quinone oxidoreductase subunit M